MERGHGWDVPSNGQRPKTGIQLGPQGLIERVQVRLAPLAVQDLAALDLRRAGIVRTGRATILAPLVAAIVDRAYRRPEFAELTRHTVSLPLPGASTMRAPI